MISFTCYPNNEPKRVYNDFFGTFFVQKEDTNYDSGVLLRAIRSADGGYYILSYTSKKEVQYVFEPDDSSTEQVDDVFRDILINTP